MNEVLKLIQDYKKEHKEITNEDLKRILEHLQKKGGTNEAKRRSN